MVIIESFNVEWVDIIYFVEFVYVFWVFVVDVEYFGVLWGGGKGFIEFDVVI